MSEIRLRYTGFVTFFSSLFSTITGLIFLVMVTRRLSPEDFGLWGIIGAYLPYFAFPSGAIAYWVTRYVARGFEVSKTAIYVNTGLSLPSLFVYFLLAPYMAASVKANVFYFLLCGFQLFFWYVASSLDAVAYGTKPQLQGYVLIVFESVKVFLGIFTVALLRLGLFGAIISVTFAQFSQVLFLLYFLRDKISGSFNRGMAKKWFTLSWIPTYGIVTSLVFSLDVIILSSLSGSTLPVAFMGASAAVLKVVSYSSFLAYGLYPKLLGRGSSRDVETALKLVLLLAIPLTIGSFILAKPLLCVLRMEYAAAENIVRVLAMVAFFTCLSSVFNAVITGTERVELKEDATFREYVKSRIFLLPTLSYIQAFFYIPSVFLLTYFSVLKGLSYISLVFYCALFNAFTTIPIVFYKWRIAKRAMNFNFPWVSLAKFLAAAGVMSVFTLVFYPSGAYGEKMWEVLSGLLPVVAIGALIYLGIVYAIDGDFRSLISSIIDYFKGLL